MKRLPPCPCGKEHTLSGDNRRFLRRTLERQGRDIDVHTRWGVYPIPRVYIAYHGIKTTDIPALAITYGWTRREPVPTTSDVQGDQR
jgi:hypothetical protein